MRRRAVVSRRRSQLIEELFTLIVANPSSSVENILGIYPGMLAGAAAAAAAKQGRERERNGTQPSSNPMSVLMPGHQRALAISS